LTQQRTQQIAQIFRRLVAAKLTGSLSESARAYSDLDALADHVAIIQEHNSSAVPRPRYSPSTRRIEGGARQRPAHEDVEDQGRADRDGREVGGAAGDRGARLLGPHGSGPGTLGHADRLAQYKEEP
jgi:hypothetical protein